MIVACPKCGAKNRLPEPSEPRARYRCGKCKADLRPDTGLAGGTSAGGRAVVLATPSERPEERGEKGAAPSGPRSGRLRSWAGSRDNQVIVALALLTLVLHLIVAPYGAIPIFDEYHYVPEAQSIIQSGNVTIPEHPPLAKLFITTGILALGNNPWGWRMPSVLFAVASVVLFYWICRRLAGRFVAALASFILVFETLTFVISGLAMLDVFSLTFMLLAFLLYLKDRYVVSGVSLALSALCKMTGVLGGLAILVHWLVAKRTRSSRRGIALFVVSSLLVFVGLMPFLDFAATREWLNPFARIWDMMQASRQLTFGKMTEEQLTQASYPWQWIIDPRGTHWAPMPAYSFVVSPTVWALIIPSMGYMLYEFIRKRSNVSLFALSWFGSTYLPWIPLVLITDRQTYGFYVYLSVGAICLAIACAIGRLWELTTQARFSRYRRVVQVATGLYLTLHVLLFLSFAPLLQATASYLY